MVEKFPKGTIKPVYRRGKNLKEILSPSIFPQRQNNCITEIRFCNNCDLCKNYIIKENKFKCTVTGQIFNVKGNITCNSSYVIYLITCTKCLEQYVGSSDDFKPRCRGHKSDIMLKKEKCGVVKHFNSKCIPPTNDLCKYFTIQLIEALPPDNCTDEHLWKREKYWQAKLFTMTHGMNSLNDYYCKKRKGH